MEGTCLETECFYRMIMIHKIKTGAFLLIGQKRPSFGIEISFLVTPSSNLPSLLYIRKKMNLSVG